MAREEARARVIEDASTLVNLKVNDDGSINVNTGAVVPSVRTATKVTADNNIASVSGVYTYYTIPNGEELTIQNFLAGSEGETGGSRTDLIYDPNGDLTAIEIIASLFTDASSADVRLTAVYVGDGTKRIVIRQKGYTASGREMFARWEGYY